MQSKLIAAWVAVVVISSSWGYAQLLPPYNEYGTQIVDQGSELFENELVRKAEYLLIENLKKYPETPSNDKAKLLQAEIDYVSGNYKIADGKLAEFIQLRANSPFVPLAALRRGYIALGQRDYAKSAELFRSSVVYSNKDFKERGDSTYAEYAHKGLFFQAFALAHLGRYDEAMPIFNECAEKNPNGIYSDEAIYYIARTYELNNKFDSALVYYRKVQESYPRSNLQLISYIREANDNLALRRPARALIALERADNILNHTESKDSIGLTYEPQDFASTAREKIMYLRGEAYNGIGNYQEALKTFKAFNGTFAESDLQELVWLGAGWASLNLGANTEALEYYDKIITKGDEDSKVKPMAQLYRVVALKRSGDTAQARRELSSLSVLPTYPYQGLVLLELGQIHYEAHEFDIARKTLERAEREVGDGRTAVRIHLLLGATYMELKMWERAQSEYRKAEKIAAKSDYVYMPGKDWYLSEAKLKLGMCLVQSLMPHEAIPMLTEFIGKNKGDSRLEEAIFWLSEAYYKTDLLKNAQESYSKLLKEFPQGDRREEAYYGLGWSYFRQKEFGKSSQTFAQMLKEFPDSKYAVEVLTRQADGYYLEKKYADAANSYRQAAKKSPGTEEGQYAAFQLCDALYKQGQFEQAITSLLDFVRVYNKSSFAPNALYLIGWIRFQQKKFPEAIDNFTFLMNSYAQSALVPRAYYAIGDSYYNLGNFEEAIKNYKIVIESFPTNELAPEAIKSIQYCLIALGRGDEAIQIANQYVQTNPDSPFAPDFQKKLGQMFYQGKKYGDAVTEFQKFVDKNPSNQDVPEVLYWMAKSYESLDENDKALDAYSRVVKQYPQSNYAPDAMLESALLYLELADIDRADSTFLAIQKIYAKDETAANAGYERAIMKYRLGDTATAIAQFTAVADSFPNSDFAAQSRYRLGMHYRSRGDNDSARKQFEYIADLPNNPMLSAEAQYRIGELWMRDKNYEQAIEAFTKVKDKFEGNEDWFSLSLLGLGEAYEMQEEWDKAREIYNAAVQIRPEDDFGKTAKSRLKRIKNK